MKKSNLLDTLFDYQNETVEIKGKNKISIYGQLKILDYKREKILLKLKTYNLLIEGKDLYVSTFFRNSISVDGEILTVNFLDREGGIKK